MTVANNRLAGQPAGAAVSRAVRLATLPNILLVACVVVAVWLVFVPLSALLYNAFTEDTGFGPGAFSLDNFIEAYSSWHILRLFWNSLVFALGTAVTTFVMGALVAWVVERTDAPGATLFHTLSLLSFAVPGLLMAMAWIFVFSPNIGWGNAVLMSAFGLGEPPVNIYSMAGMTWALSSHYFPLAYLALGPALRVLDVRMEEAGADVGRQLLPGLHPGHVAAAAARDPVRAAASVRDGDGVVRGAAPDRPSRPHRRVHHRHPGRDHFDAAGIRGRKRARRHAARDLHHGGLLLPPCNPHTRNPSPPSPARATAPRASSSVPGAGRSRSASVRCSPWRSACRLLTLVWQSFFRNLAQPFFSSAAQATLDNYDFILSYPIFLSAVKTSVLLAAMAATIVAGLTFVMAWIAQRSLPRYGFLLDALAFAPIAIPEVIVGAGILLAYLMLPIPIYNTIWILLVAYVTLYLPYGMRFASSGITQIHRELEEAASMAGAGLGQTFRKIMLPLLAPVLLAGWIYVFVLAVRELGASIFLVGPGTHVLGTISLTMWEEGGSYGAVAALGVIQIVPLAIIVAGLRAVELRIQRRAQAQQS